MPIEPITTKVSITEPFGKGLGNLVLEDAHFWGPPNFMGDPEKDRFKDPRRKFTVLIPNETADQLRELGWNVKTEIPDAEKVELGWSELSHMRVVVDEFKYKEGHEGDVEYEMGPDLWIIQGEDIEKLNSKTIGLMDKARFENIDMELRAWEYNPEEKPGQYSARLVSIVSTLRPSILDKKYGRLR